MRRPHFWLQHENGSWRAGLAGSRWDCSRTWPQKPFRVFVREIEERFPVGGRGGVAAGMIMETERARDERRVEWRQFTRAEPTLFAVRSVSRGPRPTEP
jgi:hypothetical protein